VRRRFPFIETIFADAGYRGPKMANTIAATGRWSIEIVNRSELRRFVGSPEAVDRGADLCMDQPQSPSRPRLRALRSHRRRLRAPRHDPAHAQTPHQAKPLLMIPFFLDRLSVLSGFLPSDPKVSRREAHTRAVPRTHCAKAILFGHYMRRTLGRPRGAPLSGSW
jgi:hypothetical protein